MPGTRIRRTPLAVTTPAFQDGQRIPDRYARQGRNLSPALNLSILPDGPAPLHGGGLHRYGFQIFAVDTVLHLPSGASAHALRRVLEGHVLGKGVLGGTFSR